MSGSASFGAEEAADQLEIAERQRGRFRLARYVVVGTFLSIFVLVFALIGVARYSENPEASKTLANAFNAILPVLAGWVGTVLAFYFSAASQERTSSLLAQSIRQSCSDPVSTTTVDKKMIATGSILQLQKLDGVANAPANIPLSKLQQIFRDVGNTASRVTRLVFVEGDVFKYVVHESTFNAFLVNHCGGAAEGHMFAEMLADAPTLQVIANLVVFTSAARTLAEAKAALERRPGVNDIIVTTTGEPSAPMVGWLTDVDLARALTAR